MTSFSQDTVTQQLAGLPIRFAQLTAKRAELRLESPGEKYIYEILPRLTASRKVLQPLKGAKGRFIFLSPHIPDPVAAELRSAQVAHADLNGRFFIQTPSLLIDREPKLRRYRNSGPQVRPFVLKSARVSRVLLSEREREWNQAELQKRTGISRALVSLTLAALIERELVTQTRAGNRQAQALYRVNDFGRLLDAWAAEDNWQKRVTIEQYSVLAGSLEEVAQTAHNALGEKRFFHAMVRGASAPSAHHASHRLRVCKTEAACWN